MAASHELEEGRYDSPPHLVPEDVWALRVNVDKELQLLGCRLPRFES